MKQTATNGVLAAQNERQAAMEQRGEKPKTLKDLLELRKVEIQKVLTSGLTEKEQEDVFYNNAKKLLKL